MASFKQILLTGRYSRSVSRGKAGTTCENSLDTYKGFQPTVWFEVLSIELVKVSQGHVRSSNASASGIHNDSAKTYLSHATKFCHPCAGTWCEGAL